MSIGPPRNEASSVDRRAEDCRAFGAPYKRYLLTLLTIVLAFNFVDRLALGIVLQDIKAELVLTDTQLGLLTGIAFALFYSVMGIPIARWADRGNRVTIISLTTALWSAAVALCGMATGFAHLLIIRVGVAVGEAGCVPPAQSLIADSFTRAERPRVIARYMMGGSLALIGGYFAAGWLNEICGWRLMFVIIGLPGLILATLVRLTIAEPRQMGTATGASGAGIQTELATSLDTPTFRDVCITLWNNKTFVHLLLGFSVWFLFGYGLLQWQPAFFIRSHGLQTGELGLWLALVLGVGTGLGVYLGGELAARYAANNERLQLLSCAVAFMLLAPLKAAVYLVVDKHAAFAMLALATVVANMSQGPLYAAIQTMVPDRMRASALAFVYFFANLIGMGLGPLAVGALSDALQALFAEQSLRYALVALCPGYLWSAWHLWRASRTIGSVEVVHTRAGKLAHELVLNHPVGGDTRLAKR